MKKYKKQLLYVTGFFLMSLFFFWFVGQAGYVKVKDSGSYMKPNLTEGIMPVYSFFLNVLRLIFQDSFLTAACYIQGLLASICVVSFIMYLYKQFYLKEWELLLLWFACLLPYSVELPEYVITHVIFTESISYSLYYLFVICFFDTIMMKSMKWLWRMSGMALILVLTRPQLLLLFLICACVWIYLCVKMSKKRLTGFLKGCLTGAFGVILGVVLVYGFRGLYIRSVGQIFVRFAESSPMISEYEDKERTELSNVGSVENEPEDSRNFYVSLDNAAQFGSALVARGFYEADAEDVKYYKSEELKEIFRRVYHICDENKYLHTYEDKGLWAWETMTQTGIYTTVSIATAEYLSENSGEMTPEEIGKKITSVKLQLAFTEILAHPIRFLYHCIRLMIPGFISCVFFNINEIYLLCHLVTLFLYISAILMAVWAIKQDSEVIGNAGRFMTCSVVSCIIFVAVTNIVFFGMQRYFLYQMGVFYCAYYIVLRSLFLVWKIKDEKRQSSKGISDTDNL